MLPQGWVHLLMMEMSRLRFANAVHGIAERLEGQADTDTHSTAHCIEGGSFQQLPNAIQHCTAMLVIAELHMACQLLLAPGNRLICKRHLLRFNRWCKPMLYCVVHPWMLCPTILQGAGTDMHRTPATSRRAQHSLPQFVHAMCSPSERLQPYYADAL
jgi:hypothetical protein